MGVKSWVDGNPRREYFGCMLECEGCSIEEPVFFIDQLVDARERFLMHV